MSATVVRPATSQEAALRLVDGHARIYAGGTAIQVELAKGVAPPSFWLDVSAIPGRDGVRREGAALSLGAHVRLAALQRNAELAAFAPGLAAAVASVAAPAVRRLATFGGQVAGRTAVCCRLCSRSMPRSTASTPTGRFGGAYWIGSRRRRVATM